MYTGPYISNSFLSQFPELVLSRRGDLNALCRLADIEKEALLVSNTLIPFDRFIRLLEVAEEELNMPLVALELAQRQNISILGPLSALLIESKTFADVMANIIRYFSLIASGIEVSIQARESVVEMHFAVHMPELHFRPQFQNYLLASAYTIMRLAVSKRYALRGVYFSRFESSSTLQQGFTEFFKCPVVFGASELKITADKSILAYPASVINENISRQMSVLINSPKEMIAHVEKVIALSLAGGNLELDSIARSMGYSPRTLRRHLEQEGTSFRSLVDSIRYSQAKQYLANTHYSLSDISTLLGYANQSAFTRSYKRWSGETPTKVRAWHDRDLR